jgi:two-component system chemotaxis sensor kinase CheA
MRSTPVTSAPPSQAVTLPPAPAAPCFPGATLALGFDGSIETSWLGPASPVGDARGDLFAALNVDDSTPAAARVQLLLASAIGMPAAAWPMFADDAPRVLVRRDGSALGTLWQPILQRDVITAVAVFVSAGEPPPAVADDPSERNRICVDALGLLDECDACLRHLQAEPSARHAVHRMFRAVHTIKGSTRGTELRSISDLAHRTEESLQILRSSDHEAPPDALAQLDADLKQLRVAINSARPRGEVDDAMSELSADYKPALVDLRRAIDQLRTGDRGAVPLAQRAVGRISDGAERAKLRALSVQCTATRNVLAMLADGASFEPELLGELTALDAHVELYTAVYREVAATDAGPSVLVTLASFIDAPEDRSGTFDGMVDVMSKAAVPSLIAAFVASDPYALRRALGVLADAPAMFEPARPRDDASLRFERAQRDLLAALDGLSRDLPPARLAEVRGIAQRLVWTPLAVIARKLVRMTRTLGAELGKNVHAEIDLGDLLVAPEIGRVVGDILIHAVRNAADHGIEPPNERTTAGKDHTGTIAVTAKLDDTGERVIVTVRDDGRGVSVDRVRRIAIDRGIIDPERAAVASDAELVELLFAPGFSTAPVVTAVSGRGVGMDVIRSLAEEQGGSVQLESRAGQGTTLVLDLPVAPR